jgi:hypothetical protein
VAGMIAEAAQLHRTNNRGSGWAFGPVNCTSKIARRNCSLMDAREHRC